MPVLKGAFNSPLRASHHQKEASYRAHTSLKWLCGIKKVKAHNRTKARLNKQPTQTTEIDILFVLLLHDQSERELCVM